VKPRQAAGRLVYRMRSGGTVVRWRDVRTLARCPFLDRRSRSKLGLLVLRDVVVGPPRAIRLRAGAVRLELGTTGSLAADWAAFLDVFGGVAYAAAYEQAAVLDVGAHKGYFGTFALGSGASVVLSYEPESGNYDALHRAAAAKPSRWWARNAALGALAGQASLQVDKTSTAHSLVRARRPVGEEVVEVTTLDEALSTLPRAPGLLIVKVDAEGSECEILAAARNLDRVDVLFVEWHAKTAPCSADELVTTVEPSGLHLTGRWGDVLRFERSGRASGG
jgi:FkbM family methyltransferase